MLSRKIQIFTSLMEIMELAKSNDSVKKGTTSKRQIKSYDTGNDKLVYGYGGRFE